MSQENTKDRYYQQMVGDLIEEDEERFDDVCYQMLTLQEKYNYRGTKQARRIPDGSA